MQYSHWVTVAVEGHERGEPRGHCSSPPANYQTRETEETVEKRELGPRDAGLERFFLRFNDFDPLRALELASRIGQRTRVGNISARSFFSSFRIFEG
ncbi:hypothetical protein KM043_010006 [Ampulex compressa]|nr:hypothetical protein KM043_010006 [Ampulex compressa]